MVAQLGKKQRNVTKIADEMQGSISDVTICRGVLNPSIDD